MKADYWIYLSLSRLTLIACVEMILLGIYFGYLSEHLDLSLKQNKQKQTKNVVKT